MTSSIQRVLLNEKLHQTLYLHSFQEKRRDLIMFEMLSDVASAGRLTWASARPFSVLSFLCVCVLHVAGVT